MSLSSPTPRSFDPAEVWPWENRPTEGPSRLGSLLALAFYLGLSVVLGRGLTAFHAEVVMRDRSQINTLVRPVVGPVRRIELDPRIAEPLKLAQDPRTFSEILADAEDEGNEKGASEEAPSEPVGM